MSTDLPDYTRGIHIIAWWQWQQARNFVDRWENGTFDKRKYHGRTGSYYMHEATYPPVYWTPPPIITGVNPLQNAPNNNVVNMDNTRDGITIDELYFAPASCFQPPMQLNFDAFFPAFNVVNYPLGSYVTMGFEVNSGGYIGDIFEFSVIHDGLGLRRELRWFGIVNGVPTNRVLASLTADMGGWCSYKLVLTRRYFQAWYGPLGAVLPMVSLARIRVDTDILSNCIPYFANESTIILRNVRLGQFQAFSGIKNKEVERVINTQSINAGAFEESTCQTFPRNATIQTLVTYPVGTVAGIQVFVLSAPTYDCTFVDTENVTDAIANHTPTFVAGTTVASSFQVNNLPKHGRIRVRNLDGANAQGEVQVYLHEQPEEV